MENSLALGIDLGGTKIYAVVATADYEIVAEAKMNTPGNASPDEIAAVIAELGREALKQYDEALTFADLAGIGVAVPAPVDPVTGDCLAATNLGWKDFSMKDVFRSLMGREVYIGNDANLGLFAETVCGAAQGFRTSAGYFVGTGLGGGIVINGRLHCGNSGLAGEFGHVIVRQGGRRCGCGHRGCAEAYCSKVAFVKALKKLVFKRGMKTLLPEDKFNQNSRNIKSRHLAKAYLAGDPAVRRVVNKGAYMLGVAAAGVSAVVAPDCIVLGGGVMEALGGKMIPSFRDGFESHLFGLDPAAVAIRRAALGDGAVALGATILARRHGVI